MPHLQAASVSRLVHSRTDLPRPLGLEVRRGDQVTVYLAGLSVFEAWRGALDRAGDVAHAHGWRYVAGWLVFGDRQVLTTLMARETEGTEA